MLGELRVKDEVYSTFSRMLRGNSCLRWQYPCLRGLGIQTRQLLLNKISHLEGSQAVRMLSWWWEPVRETQLGGITLAF